MGRRLREANRLDRNASHVHFNDEVHAALTEFAQRGALTLSGSIRLLVERALSAEAKGPTTALERDSFRHQLKDIGTSALACLIAIEETRRLVARILPEGTEDPEAMSQDAATAARDRLIRLEAALSAEAE